MATEAVELQSYLWRSQYEADEAIASADFQRPLFQIVKNPFLPRDASAERGDATVNRPSVRLSVRP